MMDLAEIYPRLTGAYLDEYNGSWRASVRKIKDGDRVRVTSDVVMKDSTGLVQGYFIIHPVVNKIWVPAEWVVELPRQGRAFYSNSKKR